MDKVQSSITHSSLKRICGNTDKLFFYISLYKSNSCRNTEHSVNNWYMKAMRVIILADQGPQNLEGLQLKRTRIPSSF